MPLTEVEKTQIRFHLGYPGQGTLRSMFAGLPTIVESNWQIDSLLNDPQGLKEETIGVVRNILKNLEDILWIDMPDARLEHKVEAIEELRINLQHTAMLKDEYRMWQSRMAQILCISVNPDFSGIMGSSGISNFKVA